MDLIDAALNALVSRVESAENMSKAALDEKDHRAAARFARRINLDLRLLHEAAPWVESARQGTLGLGLVYFVDEMVAALLKAPADVVMAPTADYMYSTVHDIPKWIEGALNVAIPDGSTAMVIAYPIHEPDSLFLHLLIAHELGHSVVSSEGLMQKVLSQDPGTTETGDALGAATAHYVSAHKVSDRESRARIRTMLSDWLVELLCDGLALAFLGPPFLYAFAAFATPFEQIAVESHPPFGLRTETLIAHLDSAGWRSAAEGIASNTLAWIASPLPTPPDPAHPYLADLEVAARHLAPTVTDVARSHVGAGAFQFDEAEVSRIVELLDAHVLPAQVGQVPATSRSIVFAGWSHAFENRPDEAASLASITADRDYQRFLTKALEMSTLLRTWRAS